MTPPYPDYNVALFVALCVGLGLGLIGLGLLIGSLLAFLEDGS